MEKEGSWKWGHRWKVLGRVCGCCKPSALWACGGFSRESTRPDLLFKGFLDCWRVRMMQEDRSEAGVCSGPSPGTCGHADASLPYQEPYLWGALHLWERPTKTDCLGTLGLPWGVGKPVGPSLSLGAVHRALSVGFCPSKGHIRRFPDVWVRDESSE